MTTKKKVLHSNGFIEDFKPKFIKEQLLKETNISEKEAEKIKIRITDKIKKMDINEISTSTIRAEVSAQLTSRGLFKEEEESRLLGIPIKTIDDMLSMHIKDNANMGDNSETFYKYIAEKTLEQYTFSKLPDYISKAHIEGYIHIHDRADFFVKPNCLSYSIRWFIKNGLSCDGDVKRTSVANPAKHFNVLIQHLLQALMSGKVDLSGGQGFPLFNIFLSPLTIDLSDTELKQALQTFLFGCNMSCVSKGEVVFSSIGLHPACPDYLFNEPAMSWGGQILKKTYGDFEKESQRIFKIICELLEEGDASKRPFRFPNTIMHLRDEYMDRIDDELFYFCKFLRRYPTGYFVNDDMENGGGIRAVMGCFDGDTKLFARIDGQVKYYTTISTLFDYYNKKDFEYIDVLSIDDNNKVIWHKINDFIHNKNQQIYKVSLSDGTFFYCDANHNMIDKDLNEINIFDCLKNNTELIGIERIDKNIKWTDFNNYKKKSVYITDIEEDSIGDTYCCDVNGRIIVGGYNDFLLTGNCRTASNDMDSRFTWEENILNTGNLAFHTLNLPLIAIETEKSSNIDKTLESFYQDLDKYMDIIIDSLLIRRKVIQDRLDNGRLPFLNWHDSETGERLYRIETTTLSIGFCGLNEAILELTNGDININSSQGLDIGETIIQRIVTRCKEASSETGYKFGCFSTPAESTAGRFAEINKKKYPKAFVNGSKGGYYLTNSHHINVADNTSILNHIQNADRFHKLANFGSILHIFISETPDVDSLMMLTKKIKEYNVGFWSYTLDFSICNNCQSTILKNIDVCPNCQSNDIITYSKITGYYVPIPNWGAAKVSEFNDRKRYDLSE